MAEAKARFVIEGEDRTAAAFRSATNNATRSAGAMRGAFDGAFKGIGGALAAAFSVRAIADVAMRAIEMGDELQKAGIKAGISGKAISELAFAAKMSDVDLSALSNSLRFMQKGLSEAASGTGEARTALKALGLGLGDLQGLGADKQFELLADRISQLTNPADRARAALMVFGKAGADLLPMMEDGAEGIRKAREEAVRFGQSLTDEQIQKLADMDDQIKRMKASFEGLAVVIVSKLAPSFSNLFADITAFLSGDKLSQLEEQLRFLERYKGRASIAVQVKGLNQHDRLGTQIITAAENEGLRKSIQAEIDRIKSGATSGGKGVDVGGELDAPPGFESEKSKLTLLGQITAETKLRYLITMQEFELGERFLEQEGERLKLARQVTEIGKYKVFGPLTEDVRQQTLESAQAYEQTMAEFEKNSEWLEAQKDKFSQVEEFAKAAAANIQGAFADFLFDPFQDGLKGMLKGFIDTIRRMVAEVAAQQILTALFSKYTNSGGFLGAFAKKITGNAMGGSVSAGTPYIVGERGPELFVPGYTGSIVPNHKMGGGVTIAPTYNVDARGATTDLVQQLPAILSAHARQTVELARRAINDDISRGALGRA